jgi:CubicO group peptidase (beta-lactamase class C family)
MFTATLLLQLAEEGKVRLDDPVEKYLPEVKSIQGYGDQSKITLRELASHTAGLRREPDRDEGPVDQWENMVLTCIPATSFDHLAGTGFLYSMGYRIPNGGKNYGLGLMLLSPFYIGHSGSDPGYASALVIYPKGGYAVILLRNYNVGATNLIKAKPTPFSNY